MADHPTPEIVDTVATRTIVVAAHNVPADGMAPFFDEAFTAIGAQAVAQNAEITGPAFARHYRPMTTTADLEVGLPVAEPVSPAAPVVASELPAVRVARVVHAGGYDELPDAWQALVAWVADNGYRAHPDAGSWEVYVTEPTPEMDPADLRTELNLAIADD